LDGGRSQTGIAKEAAGDMKQLLYGVGNLQSSPAMKTFYNKALLSSTAGSDLATARDVALVRSAVTPVTVAHEK